MLLCFVDPRVRKIRNKASSCLGIFSRTLRFYYDASSPSSTLPVAWFLVLGLLCRHTASNPITSGTHTSCAWMFPFFPTNK